MTCFFSADGVGEISDIGGEFADVGGQFGRSFSV
jgi:hypothetical protein